VVVGLSLHHINSFTLKIFIMEIAVINLGTLSLTNKEIETSVQALAFTVTSANPALNGLDAMAMTELILGAMEINIQKQDGSSTESLIQSLGVRDLAEIQQQAMHRLC
jgi:hypothetical protein